MNRRDMLRKLFTLAPVAAASTALAVSSSIIESQRPLPLSYKEGFVDEFNFMGWRLRWNGWREMPNMDIKINFWTAHPPNWHDYHLYSAWPGACGHYAPGALFDISLKTDQFMPTSATSEHDLEWIRNETLERLKRLVVKVGPPPFPIDKWREGKLVL